MYLPLIFFWLLQDIDAIHVLERAEAARAKIITADVDLAQVDYRIARSTDGLPMRWHMHTRIAGDQVAAERLPEPGQPHMKPDENGDGLSELINGFYSPQEGLWTHGAGSILSEHSAQGTGIATIPLANDLRLLGASSDGYEQALKQTFWPYREESAGSETYTETIEGDLVVVTATHREYGMKWWIDPKKDWSAVRSQRLFNGNVTHEARATLEQMDGFWFPRRIEYFFCQYEGGLKPERVVEVSSATFNRPEHPKKLTPSDIGVEVGSLVEEHSKLGERGGTLFWDGGKIVDGAEFNKRVRAGELRENAKVVAHRATPEMLVAVQASHGASTQPSEAQASAGSDLRAGALTTRPATFVDEVVGKWQAYTARFGKQFKLDDEQCQKAEGVGREAEEAARAYWAKHKSALDPLLMVMQKMKEDRAASQPDQAKKLAALQKELTGPFEKIFETRIEAKLKSIPTRAQFKEGGKVEAGPDLAP